jgi:hypothetical protein
MEAAWSTERWHPNTSLHRVTIQENRDLLFPLFCDIIGLCGFSETILARFHQMPYLNYTIFHIYLNLLRISVFQIAVFVILMFYPNLINITVSEMLVIR